MEDRVKLNVGGRKFETTVSTLTKYPDSLLGKIASGTIKIPIKKDEKGYIFFDRNGDFFGYILEYYRNGKNIRIPGISRTDYIDELEFWGIECEIKPEFEEIFNQFNYLALANSTSALDKLFIFQTFIATYTAWLVNTNTITIPCSKDSLHFIILIFGDRAKNAEVFIYDLSDKKVKENDTMIEVEIEKSIFKVICYDVIKKDGKTSIQCMKIQLW